MTMRRTARLLGSYAYFYAAVAYAATEALCFTYSFAVRLLSIPSPLRRAASVCLRGFCPVPAGFLSLRKTTERISMKFAGGNHYHQQIK